MDLTIIIPVYNCANYLEKGFEYLKPLYKFDITFEIIYVNDGSTDHSLKKLKRIEANNNNIIVISQKNQGSSGARNTAIDVAKGNYIQFLDSDDIIEVEKLMNLLVYAKNNHIDLLGYRMDFVDENYNCIKDLEKHPSTYNKIMSGSQCLIEGYQPSSICVFLFKKDLIIDNNLKIYPKITHMDVEFMTRVMLYANSVIFKDDIAYHYLQRNGSITKPKTKPKLEQFLFDEVIIANLMRENIKNLNITEPALINAIEKNYNSVVWNLLWRIFKSPKATSLKFKRKCIKDLKKQELFPIKGALKTPFQYITRPFFNVEWLLKILFKR